MDRNRVEHVFFLVEINGYDTVTILRGKTDGIWAVTLMDADAAIRFLKAYDLLSWYRLTMLTSVESSNWLFGKVRVQLSLSLVSKDLVQPVCFWVYLVLRTNLYAIPTMQYCLDGAQLAIDSGILGVESQFAMNLEAVR